ncbi:murein hydrolase activator EnvC [Geothrix sp. PMB-07]|uniref:murein hydrolase activator EnvC family protein n=1 Tax=Geothrix sp. PMB-07 TaxID=3068640 RepID=UPI002740DEA5|nr:peptidoglycan DD-metalloendopeptidase family protein [Geothrix sp. PMB-07]WLT31429.1 peptidoglycan DD-metalloendopeptidase family protein [Geothrix sp. PMB-07]
MRPLPGLLLPVLLPLWLVAQGGAFLMAQSAQDPAELRQKLADIQGRLNQVDQQLSSLKKRRKGVLVEIQGISLQRDRARAQVEGARLRRDQAQTEVQVIGREQARIQGEVQRLQSDLRRQVRWMQALGPWGDLGLYASFKDLEAWLVRGRMLAWARLQERKQLGQVHRLQGDLAVKEKALKEVLARVAADEKEAAQLQAALRLQEEKLNSFLDGLQKDETAQKQAQAELAEEALQLERLLSGLLGKPKGEAFEATVAFANLRGELPQPVEGTLSQAFGEHLHPRFHTKTMQSGLLIAANGGAPVGAVADGKVAFADYYQSYGPMVILDHGGGWFTLYTHLLGLSVSKGQVLRAGESVGAVGDTVDGPRLGFEIRHQAQPQDPQKWLKRRYR